MTNPWPRLLGILPRESVQAGAVAVNNGDGTYYVNLIGGGEIRVSGTGYSVGQAVFVRGGRIESIAPNLPLIQIDV